MNIYIWSYLDNLTTRYHPEGGLCIIAPSLQEARDLLRMKTIPNDESFTYLSPDCEAFTNEPDFSAEILSNESKLWYFPDGGCC